MSEVTFEKIEPVLSEKLGNVLYDVITSMEVSELKKLDWLCSSADYYIALDTK